MLDLIHGALSRRLVWPPADDLGAVPETVAREVVVGHLYHQLRVDRFPFPRPLCAPTARSTWRIAGETRRLAQGFELFRQSFALAGLERGSEADMMKKPVVVIQA